MASKSSPGASRPRNHVIEEIEYLNLTFDPHNPRLPGSEDKREEDAALRWMLDKASVVELMQSIGEHGYFAGEPLIVTEDGAPKGKYVVIEGNRRLAAVRLLHHPEDAPVKRASVKEVVAQANHKPKTLPCIIVDDRKEVLAELGFRHVTGIKAWNSLQKAKYLKQLVEGSPQLRKLTEGERRRRLARTIGTRPDYVAKLLTGLAVYEKVEDADFYGVKELREDDERGDSSFSVLYTAITSYKSIADFIGLEGTTSTDLRKLKGEQLRELVEWLFKENSEGVTRVAESRDLKELARVVGNEAAREAFRTGKTLREADRLAGGPHIAFQRSMAESINEAKQARDVMHLVEHFDPSDLQTCEELFRLVQGIRPVVRAAISGED